MDVSTAIKERRSVRAFLDKPVSKEMLTSLFEIARFAPSAVNHQPWQVAVLGPKTRNRLGTAIIDAREANIPENPDYDYYPKVWVEPYKSRRKACGSALYNALQIAIEDKESRKIQWYKNYHFFHAPIGVIIYLDARLAKGSWMDVGGFIQSVMLAARSMGLETCAQASLAEYPDLVRKIVGIPNEFHIVCGLAIGYADWSDPVNQYRTQRETPDTFMHWIV